MISLQLTATNDAGCRSQGSVRSRKPTSPMLALIHSPVPASAQRFSAEGKRTVVEYWNAVRAFSSSLRRFLLSVGLATTVYFGILAVLQNLFLLRLGFEPSFVGLVLAFGQLIWAAVAIPAGIFSARIGLRNGLVAALLIEVVGISLFLLVQNLPQELWRPWLSACQGLTFSGVSLAVVSIPLYLMIVAVGEIRYPAAL